MKYDAIVIGTSAGGMQVLKKIFDSMPANYNAAFIVVQHIGPRSDGWWISFLNDSSELTIQEAEEKEEIKKGHVYIAPPNYHLLVEKDKTFSLTIDERVNFARPSVDLLFETAAEAYKDRLIGIVMTGSNNDGANGLKRIQEAGGLTLVQDPVEAEWKGMPEAAIESAAPHHILTLNEITELLLELHTQQNQN